jgi:hypothetical protein
MAHGPLGLGIQAREAALGTGPNAGFGTGYCLANRAGLTWLITAAA